MLKFAIIKAVKAENGQVFYRPILESEDGEFKRELTSRVKRILGPKENHTILDIESAITRAFDEYKKEFKERTIKLP